MFTLFSITLFMFSLNTVLLSILNGQKEITKLTIINIFSSFVGLLFTGILTYYYNLYGALVSNVLGQTI
ncbi:polysaccharide biosynthesis C-terminal domain-containing protein, partial [Aliarcobacter lanthieri]